MRTLASLMRRPAARARQARSGGSSAPGPRKACDQAGRFSADRSHCDLKKGSRHLTSNSVIEVSGSRTLVACDYVFLRQAGGRIVPVITGRYATSS